MVVTADYAYFRLRDEGYAPDDIVRWADTIADRHGRVPDVFVYFKHEEEGKGPEFGQLLMARLAERAPSSTPAPSGTSLPTFRSASGAH